MCPLNLNNATRLFSNTFTLLAIIFVNLIEYMVTTIMQKSEKNNDIIDVVDKFTNLKLILGVIGCYYIAIGGSGGMVLYGLRIPLGSSNDLNCLIN